MRVAAIFKAVDDARIELGFDIDELVLMLRPEIKSDIPGEGTVLDMEFLRLLVELLADFYSDNPSKTHLKKYLVMKLEQEMGM